MIQIGIKYLRDSLYRNSLFLILATGAGSILGFIYWMIVARYYPAKDVGLATALISAMNLIAMFSRLGMGIGLIRYLPEVKKRAEMLGSALLIVSVVAVSLSAIYILIIDIVSPSLEFLRDMRLFVLFAVFTSATVLLGIQRNAFIGFRRAEFAFIQNLTWMGLKAVLVVFFVSLGAVGIFISWGISLLLALFLSLFVLTPKVLSCYPKIGLRLGVVKEMIQFSLGNYIAVVFQNSSQLILPIIVLNVLGAESAAYFYMAWMIAFLLFSVSEAAGSSLLAEGSYNKMYLKQEFFKAMKFIGFILFPALFFILFFGDWILNLFGKAYSDNALNLLKVLSLSAIPVALNTLYVNVERVRKNISRIITVYGFIAVFTIGVGYYLLLKFGLVGIGWAWLVANTLPPTVAGILFKMGKI